MGWQDDPVVNDDPVVQARPPVDGTVLGATDVRAKAPLRLGQYVARVPGVPASVRQSVDQWYGRNARELRQQEADTSSGFTQRFLRGMLQDPIVGTVQAAANLTPAGDAVNQAVRSDEQRTQESRALAGQSGIDLARAGGTAAAFVAPTRAMTVPATMLGRATQAGALGAAAGATMPVTEGGDFWSQKGQQTAVGGIAGLVGAPAIEGLVRVAVPVINATVNTVRRLGYALRPQQVDNLIAQALERNGVTWAQLGDDVRNALREDVQTALNAGGEVRPDAIRRLADIRGVNATPTRGAVTLDPVQVSAEKNLAKVGANSTDPTLQRLAQVENENNAALIARANQLGAGNAAPADVAAGRVLGALRREDAGRVADIDRLYATARAMNGGRAAGVDLPTFQQRFNAALDQGQLQNFVPPQIRATLNNLKGAGMPGEGTPLTVDVAQQLDKLLSAEQRAATGSAREAIAVIRRELANAPIENGVGVDAMRAYTRARDAARRRFQWHEQNPALAAAIDGVAPDRFVQDFVLGGSNSARELAQLRRAVTADPESFEAIRQQIVAHLKDRALTGASDEVGTFSQSGYNKALRAIGDAKLRVFFSEPEIAQMKQLGRAASYLQVQPKGSAVNNSNTASAAFGVLDRIFARVPVVGEFVRQPMGSYLAARNARNALNAVPVERDVIDEATRNSLIGLSPATGVAGAALFSQ